jgi:phage shock protein E
VSSSWLPWAVCGGLLLLFLLKRASLVSAQSTRTLLQSGAVVVDVRTPAEFQSGHLQSAVNWPLDRLQEAASRDLKDKNRAVLLHCLSGTRSGIARRQLKSMGFSRVYNLGSLGRARRLVERA